MRAYAHVRIQHDARAARACILGPDNACARTPCMRMHFQDLEFIDRQLRLLLPSALSSCMHAARGVCARVLSRAPARRGRPGRLPTWPWLNFSFLRLRRVISLAFRLWWLGDSEVKLRLF